MASVACAPSLYLSSPQNSRTLHLSNQFSPFTPHLTPNFTPMTSPNTNIPRLQISHSVRKSPKWFSPVALSLQDETAEKLDLKLPRRSMLVEFTCNACGERTQRHINRLAYQKGTVFVQCAGCLQHHKLVDNLGLVVEYDFRKDMTLDTSADQA